VTHEAVLAVEYDSSDDARRVERSLAPEIGDIDDNRSCATMSRDATCLELSVEASDEVALRASLNTWLSLLSVAERAGVVA
jgi:KEOPS complex subunit Pcc1